MIFPMCGWALLIFELLRAHFSVSMHACIASADQLVDVGVVAERGCLVCVARRLSGDKSPDGTGTLAPPSISFVLDATHRIVDMDLKSVVYF